VKEKNILWYCKCYKF